MGDVAGYWYWRRSSTRHVPAIDGGGWCVEVAHTVLRIVIWCTGSEPRNGAKVANALNRAYGARHAPLFDEDTGEIHGVAP